MASIINYQNVSVSVNGSTLYATNASFSFEVPSEGIRALGQRNAIANIINGRTEGNIEISYVITSASDPGRTIFNNIIAGTYTPATVVVGGRAFTAYLTSHRLSAQQNSIVEGSLSFSVFNIPNFGNMISTTAGTATVNAVGHGLNSSVDILAEAISFEYNASVEWEPIYTLSETDPSAVLFRGAEQRVSLTGPNCGEIVSKCLGGTDVVLSIGSLCGNTLFSISVEDGIITSSESSVEAGGFAEATYEITKFY